MIGNLFSYVWISTLFTVSNASVTADLVKFKCELLIISLENIKQFWSLESYIGVRIKGKIKSFSENLVQTLDVLSHGADGLSPFMSVLTPWKLFVQICTNRLCFFLIKTCNWGAMRLSHLPLRSLYASLYALLKTLLWPLCLQSSCQCLLSPMSLWVLLARVIAYFIKFVWTTWSQNVSLMWRMAFLS